MTAIKGFRVDGFVGNLAIKAPVQVASIANLTLSGEQTVDTVVLAAGDRILVKDQTDPIENGIYLVETSAWKRDGDWDGNRDVVGGTLVPTYRPSDGLIVVYVVDGAPDQVDIDIDAVAFSLYYDPAAAILTSIVSRKNADTSRDTTTLLAADPDLAGMVLAVDTHYDLEAWLQVNSASANPDFKAAFVPSQLGQGGAYVATAQDGSPAGSIHFEGITATLNVPLAASFTSGIKIKGSIRTHATLPTTVDFHWAQVNSDATPVILEDSSWVKFTKLGAA